MALLRDLVATRHLALVIVEHALNIPIVLELASRVWTLEDGRIREDPIDSVRNETAAASHPEVREWIGTLGGTRRQEELPSGAVLTVVSRQPDGAVVLDAEDLVVYRAGRRVLGWSEPNGAIRGISLRLRTGDVAMLEAPNGWGKTTLLESLMGLVPTAAGVVRVNGRAVRDPHQRVRAGVVLLRPFATLFNHLTVDDNVRLYGRPVEPIEFDGDVLVGTLSGGQRQRLAWNITVGRRSDVLLLDEPLTSMDAATVPKALATLAAMDQRAVLVTVPKRRARC